MLEKLLATILGVLIVAALVLVLRAWDRFR